MRWGYFHSLNNYVNKFSMAYTVISDCNIFAENCVYENGGNVICDWDKVSVVGHYAESGSSFSNCKRTVQGGDSNSTATGTNWRPNGNYKYTALSAAQAKSYCQTFSAAQTSSANMMYLRYGQKGVPSAGRTEAPSSSFITTVTTTEAPVTTTVTTTTEVTTVTTTVSTTEVTTVTTVPETTVTTPETTTEPVTTVPEKTKGDANSDGIFNSADLLIVQQYLLGLSDTEIIDIEAVDCSGDGRISIIDFIVLKNLLMK